MYNENLTQAVKGANKHFVLHDTAEGQTEQDKGCCWQGCRPMRPPRGLQFCTEQIADDAVCNVPSNKQYHAEGGQTHLQGSTCEKPNVEEHHCCRNNQNTHQYRAEGKQMMLFRNEPQIVHIHHLPTLAYHEVCNRHAQANQAECKGCEQVECLDALYHDALFSRRENLPCWGCGSKSCRR